MPGLKFNFFFRTTLGVFALLLIALAIKINLSRYEELVSLLKPSLLWEGYESRISYEKDLFTQGRFEVLKIFSWLLIAVVFFSFLYYVRNAERIELFVRYFVRTTWQKTGSLFLSLKCASGFQKVVLVLLVFAWILFRIFYIDLIASENETFSSAQSFYDELLTYSYFVQQGFFTIISYYPDTNNHIFFNVICFFTDPFFNSRELTMRVPVFLIQVVLLTTIFLSMHKIFNFNTAIISLALSGFLYSASIYGMIGRGFMLMSFFAFLSTIAVYKYSDSKDKFYVYVFILSSILGFYSVPVYLYPFISLMIFLSIQAFFSKEKLEVYRILKVGFLVAAGVFIVYLPVLLISGVDALLSQNRWVQPMAFSSLMNSMPAYLAELSEYILSLFMVRRGYIYAFILVITLLFFALRYPGKKYRKWLWIVLIAGMVPILIVVFMRVMAPYRAFTSYTYLFYTGIALVISTFIHRIHNEQGQKWALCLVLAGIVLWGYSSYMF